MQNLYAPIERILHSERLGERLGELFCSVLNWGALRMPPFTLKVGAPVNQTLTLHPVAQMGSLPMFRVDWHATRMPTLTARRAVYRALAPTYAEHLLCYCNADHAELIFTWARKRPDGKTELRSLPYTRGAPARTTLERLAELQFSMQELLQGEPSLAAVLDKLNRAFDVESLSKQFYQEIANWYFWACQEVRFPMPPEETNRDAYIAQSVIRLITRLLFCWFLKAKGLIPDALFDERTLTTLLKGDEPLAASAQTRFYKAILQNLFFATLNQEQDQRAFRKRNPNGLDPHRGITNLYRYEDLFTDPNRFLELVRPIPFLNGGLFECLDEVYRKEENRPDRRIDGFSDHPKNPLHVPDYLFFGEERSVDITQTFGEKRIVRVRGLIHTLKRYNFTVTESTPLDQQVALDPELAGKVFENLLAAYNPETATTARKATGSYYTPREIVDFMVEESLIRVLHDALQQAHPDAPHIEPRLRQLFDENDDANPFNEAETRALIDALDALKTIDPACGSGAFPMGMLHKLVFLLGKLDPRNERWKEKQIERARALPGPEVREKVIEDIENAFERNELDYGRKLFLIENGVYGVDIQPIAVQIAKMRFFIALIVDQQPDPSQPNSGVRPLPNLEIRFVAADTLKRIRQKPQEAIPDPHIEQLKAQIRQVRQQYFTARTPQTKQKLRQEDAELRQKLADELKKSGWDDATARMLARWNPYDQNASAPFFDPEWMFGVSEGFDIAIGNPPYIQLQKAYDAKRKYADLYLDEGYATFDRRGDIYCLFYERGLELLREGGILAYITSNKWMRAGYGEKLRAYFAKNTNPLLLIDLGPGVFESATVDTNILILQKAPNQQNLRALTYTDRAKSLREATQTQSVVLNNLSTGAWFIGGDAEQRLKGKIEALGKPLRDWEVKIYRGILTGLNEAFIIDTATRERILDACKDNAERQRTEALIKPILRGRDIKRYAYEWKGLWVIGTFPALRLNIEDYPAVKKYFLEHFDIRQLEQSGKRYPELGFSARKKTGNKWFETQDQIAYYAEFEKEKVVWQELAQGAQFAYDPEGRFFVSNTAYILTGKNIKYLLAYLNSNLNLYAYEKWYCTKIGSSGVRWLNQHVLDIPAPPITPENQSLAAQIESLVEQILARKRGNPNADTSALEREIDRLVYQLYDLTPEEIRLVESSVRR
ncbi:MAG: N-6 DNA methylase [Fimbriimonadales bacterium]